jgi:glycosidase
MEKISFALFCGLFLGIHGAWFDNGVFYQVYPQSFKEGNGKMEGHGDFKGIIEKLDYIKDLGVDAIWLNPFYNATSHGYDIKDFKSIDSKVTFEHDF